LFLRELSEEAYDPCPIAMSEKRLIVLYDKTISPPLPGMVVRARDFASIALSLATVLAEPEEVIVAGPYLELLSTASMFFPRTVVGLLTAPEEPEMTIRELKQEIYDLSQVTTLLFWQTFPPHLSRSLSLVHMYKADCQNLIELARKMSYDDLLMYHLFGTPPFVVQVIAEIDRKEQGAQKHKGETKKTRSQKT
jgi:hypothetical protein